MSAIDTSFERVFEELRAERADMRAQMRAERAKLARPLSLRFCIHIVQKAEKVAR